MGSLAGHADSLFNVLPVVGFHEGGGEGEEFFGAEPLVFPGDFFQAGDLQSLAFLDRPDKLPGLHQRFVRPRIQPGMAAAQTLHRQLPSFQVGGVHGGDLQFAPGRGLHPPRDLHHLIIVEVEAGDGVIGFGALRFFFDGERVAILVKFHHAEALRVADVVAEDGRAALPGSRAPEQPPEIGPVKDVIPQNQRHRVLPDKIFADDERLGQAIGRGLDGIGDTDSELASVSEESLKSGLIFGRGNDQDIPYPRQHQDGHGVVDHRFIVDRQKLLGDPQSHRMQPRPSPTRQDDSFSSHGYSLSFLLNHGWTRINTDVHFFNTTTTINSRLFYRTTRSH